MNTNSNMMLYDAQKKSAGVAYLLFIFFGSLGVHRFYVGDVGMGFLILALLVVPFFLLFPTPAIAILMWGLLGIILLCDLFRLGGLVGRKNLRLANSLSDVG